VHEDDSILDTAAVAKVAGVAPETVRMYLKRSRRRLRDGEHLRSRDLPLPDLQVGRSPAWHAETVRLWLKERRPRKAANHTGPTGENEMLDGV